MGDLAKHIARTARRRHPASAIPEPLVELFAEMGRIGVDIDRQVGLKIERPSEGCIAPGCHKLEHQP
jgi:phosphate transport system protein